MIISTDVLAIHTGTVLEQEHKFDQTIQITPLEFYSEAFPSVTQIRSTFHGKFRPGKWPSNTLNLKSKDAL